MLKVFYFLLSLGMSQSLAVISNAQQDLALKSIVYKHPSNLYLPANLQQISTATSSNEPQYQATVQQNSASSTYNGPSYQYLPHSTNQKVITSSNLSTPPYNELSQYQPTFAQNSLPSNSNQYSTSSSKQEVSALTSFNVHTTPSYEFNQYQPISEQNSHPTNNGPSNRYSSKQEVPTLTSSNVATPPQYELSQYQPTAAQNSLSSNYNEPSNQYLSTSSQQQVKVTPSSYGNSFPLNGLSHNQSTSAQNSIPAKKHEDNTTPGSIASSSSPSTYYGPAHQYLPATSELTQTTTPLTSDKQISEHYPFIHSNHWNPIKDQRQQQTITNNLRPNTQPPIELHHGYRYIEPAQKINTTKFQPIAGIKYNELGLGQNVTNTLETPETVVQNNRPSKTEFQTHHGYVYGNAQYSQHYPNTTVLRPVPTPESSYNYHQENHNRLGSHNFYNNTQESQQQQEKQLQNAISIQEQYPNHRYTNSELNAQQTQQTSATSTGNRATGKTPQHANTKPNSQQSSSQSGSFTNKVNLITNPNNIATPQTEPNRFITEVTQQMAAQIYPHLYAPNQISSSNTVPNVQTVPNQYYTDGNQQTSLVTFQQNPLNYEPPKRVPSVMPSFNNIPTPLNYKPSFIVNIQTPNNNHISQSIAQTRPISDGAIRQTQPSVATPHNQLEIESNQYSFEGISQTSSSPSLSSSTAVENNMPNGQTQSYRYDSAYPTPIPSNQQQLKPDYNHHYSTTSQQPSQVSPSSTTSNSRPNFQTQNNKFVSSSHLTQTSNQNQQNTDSKAYYAITSQQPLQISNNRPNVQIQSSPQQTTYPANQKETNVQTQSSTQQSTYTANKNQQPSQVYNFKPNVQTQSSTQQPTYPVKPIQPLSQTSNTTPNVQTQAATQPIHPSYQTQQNTITNYIQTPSSAPTLNGQNGYYSHNSQHSNPAATNSIIRPNVQIESNPIYSVTYPQQHQQTNYESNQNNQNTAAKTTSNSGFAHYYYNSPQQSIGMPQTTTSYEKRPIVPANSQRFFPSSDLQSAQSPIVSSNSHINAPNSQAQSNQGFITPQQSILSFPQNSLISNQLQSNSNNITSAIIETPRYNPTKQNLHQTQQHFLAKPTPTSQVPSATTVGHFFGQTSATSTTASISANNNANIIQQTSNPKPGNLMSNSNYLQMQSHSFEMPYYYTMPAQPNYGPTMQQPRPTTPVEPRRLPHLIYGTPVNEPSNTYLPPSLVMQTPYY